LATACFREFGVYPNRLPRSEATAGEHRKIRESTSRCAFYRAKASEMKARAEHVHDPQARRQLFGLYLGYELLADRVKRFSQA
jgi:hypothetical protein